MPDKDKECFSVDDFHFSQPYMDNSHCTEMAAWFNDTKNDDLIDKLLSLNPQEGEYISEINAVWDGNGKNPPYISAVVLDGNMRQRSCIVPMEEGSSEKLADIFSRELNKTSLDRFCGHLDEIGERWSYTDESKTCIECTYMNNGKPYQVYADGERLRFEGADSRNSFADRLKDAQEKVSVRSGVGKGRSTEQSR